MKLLCAGTVLSAYHRFSFTTTNNLCMIISNFYSRETLRLTLSKLKQKSQVYLNLKPINFLHSFYHSVSPPFFFFIYNTQYLFHLYNFLKLPLPPQKIILTPYQYYSSKVSLSKIKRSYQPKVS